MAMLQGLIGLAKQAWAINNTGAANAQATVTKAAGGNGIRHVATAFQATLGAGSAASTQVTVNLRDGATGAGNVLWTGTMQAAVNSNATPLTMSGLYIMGSPNTPMTLEFATAGGATTVETVCLQGFDLSDF